METIIVGKSRKNEVLNDFRLMVRNKIDRQKKAQNAFKAGKYDKSIAILEELKNKN